MVINKKDLGKSLLFGEIKVGMKVIFPDYNSTNDNEFEIATVREIEPGMGEALGSTTQLEEIICDKWFVSEESNYIIPYSDGAIFPLTKRIKTKLLLEGKLI